MHRNIVTATLIATILVGINYAATGAGLPENRTHTLNFREITTDSNSAGTFVATLDLEAVESDGNWVGWEIAGVEFRQPGIVEEFDARTARKRERLRSTRGSKVRAAQMQERLGSTAVPDTIWYEAFPFVDSPDGLWWIEHDNHLSPRLSEFVLPPRLVGTATAQEPLEPDLEYELEDGAAYITDTDAEGAPVEAVLVLNDEFNSDEPDALMAEPGSDPNPGNDPH